MHFTRYELERIARHPSGYAPTLAELNAPRSRLIPLGAEEQALLAAVSAEPESDTPRLRYADWLDARDPVRAEFIRLQLANTASPRCTELLARHAAEWNARYAPWSAEDIEYRRGFAEAMSLSGRAFISGGERLFHLTPLRAVRFVAVQHIWGEFVACPMLNRLCSMNLWGNAIGDDGAILLAACPYLSSLRELNLARNALSDAGAQAILQAPWASHLQSLDLSDNALSAEVMGEVLARGLFLECAR